MDNILKQSQVVATTEHLSPRVVTCGVQVADSVTPELQQLDSPRTPIEDIDNDTNETLSPKVKLINQPQSSNAILSNQIYLYNYAFNQDYVCCHSFSLPPS